MFPSELKKIGKSFKPINPKMFNELGWSNSQTLLHMHITFTYLGSSHNMGNSVKLLF